MYFEQSVRIYQSAIGERCPEVAVKYNNIGLVYFGKGDYDKALEYIGLAIDILLEFVPEDHPQVALFRQNIDLVKSVKDGGPKE